MSDKVRDKIKHAKQFDKAVKRAQTKLASTLDIKQVRKACKALAEFVSKPAPGSSKGKQLFDESEDKGIYVTFTLTQVPTKPTPKPL